MLHFMKDRRGNVAITFAFFLTILIAVAGLAIDYARGVWAQRDIQAATDTAVMGLAVLPPSNGRDGRERAISHLNANSRFDPQISELILPSQAQLASGDVRIRLATVYRLPTTFMQIFGVYYLEVGAVAEATRRFQRIQIALALDNSGSMINGRIEALRSAATTVVDTLAYGKDRTEDIEFALVPFSGTVNVGANYQNSGWIDRSGVAPNHSTYLISKPVKIATGTMQSSTNQFDLFQALNEPWGGCVEARVNGLDVSDEAPHPSKPESLFVPTFAPDEPGAKMTADMPSSAGAWTNSYIADTGVAASACPAPTSDFSRMRWTCKYYGATLQKPAPKTVLSGGIPNGPNLTCTTPPLTRLTKNAASVKEAIKAMIPFGGTNIAEGAAWGFRTLSRNGPFAEGMPADAEKQGGKRILIVMTDGDNWYDRVDNAPASLLRSRYGAYGYVAENRVEQTNWTGPMPGMDAKTLAVCTNAKDNGIDVYTVGLSVSAVGKTMLTACASRPDKAFMVSDNAALVKAFKEIANKIKAPFLSQ